MTDLNKKYRYNLKHWLTYIIGFAAILLIFVVGAFYMAKPYLDDFVKRELTRRAIIAETSKVSIMGKVNLTHVTLPVPAGTSLKIGAISARPPIYFIPGTFTLYNVDLKHNNIHVQIPKISLKSVSLKEKDTAITPHLLQLIMRIKLASIFAPDISLSIENKSTQKIKVKNFQLSNLKNGYIRSVSIKNMNFTTAVENGNKQMYLVTKSDAIKAQNIDINYAYSIFCKENNSFDQGKTVTGPVSLNNVMVDIFKETEKSASFSLGQFKTSGLQMKPFKQSPKKLIKAYLNARNTNNQIAKKTAQNDILLNTFLATTSVDAKVDNVTVDIPQLKATLESLQFKPSMWKQPIPKKILLSLDNLSISPNKIKEKSLNPLKKMNFESLDISGNLDISYDEKERTLFLNTISLNVKDVGSGEISAKITDVGEKLFTGQKDIMIAASQDIGINEINIHYMLAAGFIDKIFSFLTENLNDEKYDLKKELYDVFYLVTTQILTVVLKSPDKAKNIVEAISNLSKNPQTFTVKIKAKNNKSLKIADLKSLKQKDLSTVLSKIHLTIDHEK
ncbi:hypothetical protein [Bartonella sp. CB169]|uniref:hypothetical protein n=1 Tax=Bartonella sp. CB169 TaxID=3112257 RepID=UPI00300E4EFB